MRVELRDGHCRTCGGELEIVSVDDATMSVECKQCGDEYPVEPDAFGDGAHDYFTQVRCRQLFEADANPLTLPDFLTQLKLGEPVPMAPWEGSEELIPRVAQAGPGSLLAIDEETFFHYLELLPPRFQRRGEFCFAEGSGPFLYFWKSSKGVHYARPLSDEETDTFCRLAKVSRYL
jgi:hypothetical protein